MSESVCLCSLYSERTGCTAYAYVHDNAKQHREQYHNMKRIYACNVNAFQLNRPTVVVCFGRVRSVSFVCARIRW